MPQGKPAGVRCIQLDAQDRCMLFGDPRRPAVCGSLQPSIEMCGADRAQAMRFLDRLEHLTASCPAAGGRDRRPRSCSAIFQRL